MQHTKVAPEAGFRLLFGSEQSQAATMVLEPGTSTGGPDNAHRRSDQWLFVLSGRGIARIYEKEETVPLEPGTLVFIEAGETHEIAADDRHQLQTLNLYAPPEY